LLVDERLRGPVNLTAPAPVSQRELAHAIGRALGRPSSLPPPRAAVGALFGQMGREVLLAGARVRPTRLTDTGFRFRWDTIDAALGALVGRAAPADARELALSFSES
jgi:NAD dependent epimerase/dehydratase family enzyme